MNAHLGRVGVPSGVAVALVASLTGCTSLTSPEPGVCGNGVLEPQAVEDCDGSPDCFAPDEPTPCAWSCAEAPCPDGFACGLDEVCRAPSSVFEIGAPLGPDASAWVDVRDLTGDGRDDLITLETGTPGEPVATLTVRSFDASGAVASTWTWEDTTSVPSFGDANDDGLDDIVLSIGHTAWWLEGRVDPEVGAIVLRNLGDGTFEPMLSSYGWAEREDWLGMGRRLRRDSVTGFPGHAAVAIADGRAKDVPRSDDETPTILTGDTELLRTELNIGFETGPTADAQCARYAFRQDDVGPVVVAGTCGGTVLVEAPAPEFTFSGKAVFADIDGDGLTDLLASGRTGTQPRDHVWVAYGVADGSFHSTAPAPASDGDGAFAQSYFVGDRVEQNYGSPILAAGDLNGDGVPEVVTEHLIALAVDCAVAAQCDCAPVVDGRSYACLLHEPAHESDAGGAFGNPLIEFTEATDASIVDLEGDGVNEVVMVLQRPGGAGASIRISRWDGLGFAAEEHFLGAGVEDPRISVADLDQDGLGEVVINTGESIDVLWGDGNAPTPVVSGLDLAPGVVAANDPNPSRGEIDVFAALRSEGLSGFVRLRPAGGRRLASPLTLRFVETCHFDGDGPGFFFGESPCTPTVDRALAGHFSDVERPEIVALSGTPGGANRDSAWSLQYQIGFDKVLQAGTPVGNFFDPDETPGTQAVGDWIPKTANLVADWDGDGLDEIMAFGPAGSSDVATDVVLMERRPSGAWVANVVASVNDVGLGGRWPAEPAPADLVRIDLDLDGAQDVFGLGRGAEGQRVAVVLRNGAPAAERLPEDPPGLESWTFTGPPEDRASRFVSIEAGEIVTGTFDARALTREVENRQPGPSGVRSSTTGDFDGDGLLDVAFATDTGTVLARGRSARDVATQ